MLKILFAINQNMDNTTEENLLKYYKNFTGEEFTYSKEYDLSGVRSRLIVENFGVVVLNEELERDNSITTTYIDELTDKYPSLRIILITMSDHERDPYIKKLFNIGTYDLLYTHDISIEAIVNLLISPRTKAEAKMYLELSDVDDAVVEKELTYIPDDQLDNITSFFERTDKENISLVFDRVYSQYNEKQMIYLCNHLPAEIKEVLKGNSLFENLTIKLIDPGPRESIEHDVVEDVSKKDEKKTKASAFSLNFKPEIQIIKPRDTVIRDKLIGSVFIGIANSIRGSGSSYVSLAIGSYLNSIGLSVAILEVNPNPYFANLAKDKSNEFVTINGIDIYYMNKGLKKNEFPIPEFKKNYQYVISDLGVIKSFENNTYMNNGNYQEFLRSAVKILMVSGTEWKWGEVYPFLINENIENWNLFVSPSTKKLKSIISKELSSYTKNIYHLPFNEDPLNPDEELINIFEKSLDSYIGVKSKNKIKLKLPKLKLGNKA